MNKDKYINFEQKLEVNILHKHSSEVNGIMLTMGNFNRGRSGGGRSFGGKRDFNNRGADRPTLHKTICNSCQKECEVPFKPTGNKPVFCRDCFKNNGGSKFEREDFSRPLFDKRNNNCCENAQCCQKGKFEEVNRKLDKVLELLTGCCDKKEETAVISEEESISPKKKKIASK
jgi:CxxC-x17-CxxC domain-containing protein